MRFRAHDKINDKPIDLYRITIGRSGEVMSVIDINGEHYGMHQAELIADEPEAVIFVAMNNDAGGMQPGEKRDGCFYG